MPIHAVKRYKMNKLKLPTNFETIAINEQTNYRLNEINKIKDYFECEIKKQQTIKKLSKYITGFDYTDKVLTVFLTVFSAVSIFSHIKTKKTHRISEYSSYFVF